MSEFFKGNADGWRRLQVALRNHARAVSNNVKKIIVAAAQEYRRQLAMRVPRELGFLAQSWQVNTTETKDVIMSEVGTSIKSKEGVPYPALLEFGTERIAGGRVMEWQLGDEPILEWPAKLKDAAPGRTVTMKDYAVGRYRDHLGRFASMKMGNRAEQMPFLRPIGLEIRAKVIPVLRDEAGVKDLDGFVF